MFSLTLEQGTISILPPHIHTLANHRTINIVTKQPMDRSKT